MRRKSLPPLQSERLRDRVEALRGEVVIGPDWRRTGYRAILIGLLFGVGLVSQMGGLPMANWVADAALLAGASFLLGINVISLTDRRLWLEKAPPTYKATAENCRCETAKIAGGLPPN